MTVNVGDEVRLNQYALKLNNRGGSNSRYVRMMVGRTVKEVTNVDDSDGEKYYFIKDRDGQGCWEYESLLEKKITLDNGKTIYVSLSNKR